MTERDFNENNDPLLSPGYYQEGSCMTPEFRRDMFLYHKLQEAEKNKIETHSLHKTEGFVFSKKQEIFGWPLEVDNVRIHHFLTVPAKHLIRKFGEETNRYQVRISGQDYAFFLKEKDSGNLKQISKAEALTRSIAQFLHDRR